MALFKPEKLSPKKWRWMRCEDTRETLRSMRQWYAQRPGIWLKQDEQAALQEILPDLFGYHFLQLGWHYDLSHMRCSRIPHQMVMDLDACWHDHRQDIDDNNKEGGGAYPGVFRGAPEFLPVASDSLDVVLLQHSLEFSENPHQILREVDRVLIPEGHVVISCFNPFSLWMLWKLIYRWRKRAPWCGHFISLIRLRDWLELLGFDVLATHQYFFRPPLAHAGLMQRLWLLEKIGKKLWPFLSGAYIVVAKKRVATLTPLKPRWRPRRSRLVTPELAGNSTATNGNSLKK